MQMNAFECQVCFESCSKRLALPRLATLNGDVLRLHDCNHPICQSCMAAFVTARVEEHQAFNIFCPIEGCKNELFEQDVQNLVHAGVLNPEVSERLAKLRKQEYTSRLSETCSELKLDEVLSMRLCPRCNVIIQKSSGCNSFGCICGHRFRFDQAPSLREINTSLQSCLLDLTSKHDMSSKVATKRIITAFADKGIKNYSRVLKEAENKNISVDTAELHAAAFLRHPDALKQLEAARRRRRLAKVQNLLSSQLGSSLDEALVIVEQARAGDEEAWAKIRRARMQLRVHEQSCDLASCERVGNDRS